MINVTLLCKNITKSYVKYNKLYDKPEKLLKDAWEHYTIYEDIEDEENPKKKAEMIKQAECIIEIGFYSYFILSHYNEIKDLSYLDKQKIEKILVTKKQLIMQVEE